MNVIVERQSPDWGGEIFDRKVASDLIARSLRGGTTEEVAFGAHTLALHDLWEQCFAQSFASCRMFLKEIAHETWEKVNKCDGIYSEQQHDIVASSIFGTPGWVLFTDDDDWYAPDVFERIADARAPSTAQCILWKRMRFNGVISINPIAPTSQFPLWAYTNNYAVNTNLFAGGTSVSGVMQHEMANQMVEQRAWEVCLWSYSGLSITNKSPCSWGSLNQASQSQHPVKNLVSKAEEYAYSLFDLNVGSRWAAPYIKKCQTFFKAVLRSAHSR